MIPEGFQSYLLRIHRDHENGPVAKINRRVEICAHSVVPDHGRHGGRALRRVQAQGLAVAAG
jgi:hypothetical protein